VFVLGSTAFVVGSEWLVRTLVVPTSDYEAERQALHSETAQYVAFADSHGANGLMGGDGFANLSRRGDDLTTILAKARFVAARYTPKGIILPADPHLFSLYRLVSDQAAMRQDLFYNGEQWLQFMRPIYRQYLLDYWQTTLHRLYNGELLDQAANAEIAVPRLSDQSPSKVAHEASLRVQLQTPIEALAGTPQATEYEATIYAFKRAGIRVCLIGFPVSAPYQRAEAGQPSFREARAYFADVARRLDVRHFDYSAAFPDSEFGDPDHLNAEGARRFTPRVLRDCFGSDQ
jgi:hypothetical protein